MVIETTTTKKESVLKNNKVLNLLFVCPGLFFKIGYLICYNIFRNRGILPAAVRNRRNVWSKERWWQEKQGKVSTNSFKIEGVCGKKFQVSLDLMSNCPFLYKEVNSNLLGESCSSSDVTYSLFPCTPSIDTEFIRSSVVAFWVILAAYKITFKLLRKKN